MSESRLQNARVVALRALCLGALLTRYELETRVKTLSEYRISEEDRRILTDKRQAVNDRLHSWLQSEKLSDHLTPAERNLLEKPLGSWSGRALTLTTWRAETLGMLLWALRVIEYIPTFDTPFEVEELLPPLDILNATIDLIWTAELRSNEQLFRMRDTAEMWDWRSRATELQRMGIRPSEGVNYSEVIRTTAEQAHADGTLPAPIDGDFPAFGKSFASLNDDEYDLLHAIATERYQAMCWITENTAEWEHLPADL
jgi:hypothetical protein